MFPVSAILSGCNCLVATLLKPNYMGFYLLLTYYMGNWVLTGIGGLDWWFGSLGVVRHLPSTTTKSSNPHAKNPNHQFRDLKKYFQLVSVRPCTTFGWCFVSSIAPLESWE